MSKPTTKERSALARVNERYVRTFSPGEVICREDTSFTAFFYIAAGLVYLYRAGADGNKHVETLSIGDLIGVAELFTGKNYQTTAMAATEVTVVEAPVQDIRQTYQQQPELIIRLARYLAEKSLLSTRQMVALLADRDELAAAQQLHQQTAIRMGALAEERDLLEQALATLLCVPNSHVVIHPPPGKKRTGR